MPDVGISGSLTIPLRNGRLLNEREALRTILTMIAERERTEGFDNKALLQSVEHITRDVFARVWLPPPLKKDT